MSPLTAPLLAIPTRCDGCYVSSVGEGCASSMFTHWQLHCGWQVRTARINTYFSIDILVYVYVLLNEQWQSISTIQRSSLQHCCLAARDF
jgi:hypothetical protein